jgi:two-component system NtrC family sensor kinase
MGPLRPPGDPPPRLIARLLALGFGAVSVVAVAMCAMLLAIIHDVSQLVSGMRHDEHAIRQGLDLATAVREESLLMAGALVAPDPAHVAAYEARREQVRARIQQLSAEVPAPERWRLHVLGEKTQRMHEQFVGAALPAARQGDLQSARAAHAGLEALGREAAEQADALARAVESKMAHAHVLATNSTRLGLLGGGLCVLLVLGLSAGFTVRLRAAVLKPLVALTDAAGRFGRGDFAARVGDAGQGELGALAQAFDRMTEELAAREARLVQSERMAAIGQLAAGVAHELNNPIGIIRGYLKTMSPDGDPETLREELGILDEEAAQCQRIAEDLLSYARAQELALEPLSAAALLEETGRRFQESPAAGGRRIQVAAEEAELEVDGPRVRQVLLNLLTNAAQASPPDTQVHLRGMKDGLHYRVEVEDSGPGVPPEERARVFEPFYSRRRGGSGLGLSVALGIVRAHRGAIEVGGGAAGGAVFRVRLPLRQGEGSAS